VEYNALRDLQTGILQGYRVALSFLDDPSRDKNLYLLGELMPINFLYYGIPREIVDEVMAQLFTLSCGVVRRQRSAEKLPPKMAAVDRQIDADANDIEQRERSVTPRERSVTPIPRIPLDGASIFQK
jgi:hypothetical protein